MADPMLTVPEATHVLRDHGVDVTDETVRRWARNGKLRHVVLPSGRVRFRRDDIDAFLAPIEPDVPVDAA